MNRNTHKSAYKSPLILKSCAAAVLGVAGASMLPAHTLAQSAQPRALEEIVVTAQRREQTLQDVPIAITAITADAMERRGIQGNEELVQLAPALNIGRSGSTPLLYLRGIGNQSGSPGSEPSVPLYIDGVYVLGQTVTLFSFNNIERVEVLRGPQGTLFGRNATGGLMHVITRKPSFEPQAELTLGYGNYNTLEGNFYGSTGLTDNVAIDLAAFYTDRGEGFGNNVVTGNEVGLSKEYALRSKLLIQPGDNTEITLAGDYVRVDSDIGLVRQFYPGTIALDGVTRRMSNEHDIQHSFDPFSITHRGSGALTINHEFSGLKFVSISAYQENSNRWVLDLDGTAAGIVHASTEDLNTGWTQEFQLQNAEPGKLDWVLGAYFLDSTIELKYQTITGLAAGPAVFLRRQGEVDTESMSFFAQGTYELLQDTNLTLGVRWTKDEKSLDQTTTTAFGTGAPFTSKLDDDQITYRIALDHQLTEDLMLYGTISRGYKSGEFNLTTQGNPPIEAEILDAYEVGIKSQLLDNRLRLNLSAFYYEFDDLQLSQQLGASTLILNATSAKFQGAEFDFEMVVTDHLTVSGGAAFTDGEYKDFPGAPMSFNEPYSCALGGPGPGDPNFGNQQCFGNAKGNETVRTPPVTANLGISYEIPFLEGQLGLATSLYYTDRFFYEVDNRLKEDAYTIVNAEVRWENAAENFILKGWSKNLFDKEYAMGASASTADQYLPANPRTFGVSATFRY